MPIPSHVRVPVLPLLTAAFCAALLLASNSLFNSSFSTTNNLSHQKEKGSTAFVLSIVLTFSSEQDANYLIKNWNELSEYCYRNEPGLLSYKVSKSDKLENTFLIFERYSTKDYYLNVHRNSEAFHRFRPLLGKMVQDGVVTVSGESYVELGAAGFV